MHSLYTIKNTDKFQWTDYPKVVNELAVMIEGIAYLPSLNKGDILISYFKDHSVNSNWAYTSPKLVKLITSGLFPTSHVESLFESCRKNKNFLQDLEAYIKNICKIP